MLNEGCILCPLEAMQTFQYWKVVPNKYPYDKIAKRHEMIIPLRHTDQAGVTNEEWQELAALKASYIDDNYEFLLEATPHRQSVPAHFHLHAIVSKD